MWEAGAGLGHPDGDFLSATKSLCEAESWPNLGAPLQIVWPMRDRLTAVVLPVDKMGARTRGDS